MLKHEFRKVLGITNLFLAIRQCLPPEMLGLCSQILHALHSLKISMILAEYEA
jgi:hypothetical protein